MFKFKSRISIAGIGFKSANDCPHRDPTSVRISILADNYSNEHVATYDLDFEEKRWHTLKFMDMNLSSKQYFFQFSNSRCAEIQLGEIILYAKN